MHPRSHRSQRTSHRRRVQRLDAKASSLPRADNLIFNSPAYVSRIRRGLNRANFRMRESPVSIPATLMSIEFEELVELFGTHLSRYAVVVRGRTWKSPAYKTCAESAIRWLRSYPIGGPSPSAKRGFNSSSMTVPPTISRSRTAITGTTELASLRATSIASVVSGLRRLEGFVSLRGRSCPRGIKKLDLPSLILNCCGPLVSQSSVANIFEGHSLWRACIYGKFVALARIVKLSADRSIQAGRASAWTPPTNRLLLSIACRTSRRGQWTEVSAWRTARYRLRSYRANR